MSKSKSASVSRSRFILLLTVALFLFAALELQIFPSRHVQAISTTVVISEFRTRGPSGANDEFVELYNVTGSPIDIGGWKINRSNGTGTINTQITITAGIMIPAFGHFLATNSVAGGYSGSLPGNQTYGTGITDDGGIAILDGSNAVIDEVGMSAGSAYKERTVLSQLTTNVNRSHERKPGGASGSTQDTDDNGNDFQLITPSDPQNLSSPPTPSGSPTATPTPTNPTGVGAANPCAVLAGNQTLLTVTVTPGSNPASTGLSVSGDLSSIGGSATQQFFDDGTNGDVVAGNNVFSYRATLPVATTPGTKTIPFSITDAQLRPGSGNIPLIVAFHDPAEHMVMGNPSGAVTEVTIPLNYLMMKPQYALSYNDSKGTSNWTSWHLDCSWTTGVADRQNDFRSDNTLPPTFKHVSNGYQFATYGFERGHMCPSADRTSSIADNSATFLMTNMVPQATGNNQGPWESMEEYIRQLSDKGNELYIISGGTGIGGTSSTGPWDSIIDTAGNTVTVPRETWKVVMVLPNATGDDVARVSTSTRTFAVIMPNDDNIRPDQWQKYLATIDQVEALSSYDFYSNVPTDVQDVIEARLDAENDTAPVTSNQTVTTGKDQGVAVTLSTTDVNVNNTFTYQIVGCPSHGSLSDSNGNLTCPSSNSNGNLTYSPNPHYVGPDLFTFQANDGALGSNVSTVTIMVNESGILQFSAATYTIGESAGSATVTVTRSGNTTAEATVNYATSDTSGANNCNVFNGDSSARCDYVATLGTLPFAANETSKTISILIVDDSYAEGPESFTLTLSDPSVATLSSPATATVTINDNDPVNGTNPIDASGFFVRQHYIDFLNREPDPSGFAFWTGEIDNCTSKPQCTEIKRIHVSAAFYLSIEFQGTGYLVERIYKAAYGDASGTSTFNGPHQLSAPVVRLNEFLSDTQEIGQGVIVNQGNWQQQLEDNKNAFTAEIVQRSRFVTAFPPSMSAVQFVDTLNTNAGNPLSQSERDQLVNDLSTSAKTRAQVLRAVAEDPDLNNAEFNRAFVLMQYFGYLRRNPNDPQDTDYTGYDFWLTKLNQFNGNFVNAEMVKAFIVSAEYRRRFGP